MGSGVLWRIAALASLALSSVLSNVKASWPWLFGSASIIVMPCTIRMAARFTSVRVITWSLGLIVICQFLGLEFVGLAVILAVAFLRSLQIFGCVCNSAESSDLLIVTNQSRDL